MGKIRRKHINWHEGKVVMRIELHLFDKQIHQTLIGVSQNTTSGKKKNTNGTRDFISSEKFFDYEV